MDSVAATGSRADNRRMSDKHGEPKGGDMVRMKATASHEGGGVELALGEGLPGWLAKLMPKRAVRSEATRVMGG